MSVHKYYENVSLKLTKAPIISFNGGRMNLRF